MQLLRLENNIDKNLIAKLIEYLNKSNTYFALEFFTAHLSNGVNIYISVPSNFDLRKITNLGINYFLTEEHSIFNHRGVHLIRHLKVNSQSTPEKVSICNYPRPKEGIGEGFAIQYHCSGPEKCNINLVSSAPTYYRASEILDEAYSGLKKHFVLTMPKDYFLALADYSYRKFNDQQNIILTSEQLVNIMPLLPIIVENLKLDTLAIELKNSIKGEILLDEASLEYYSTDASVFKIKPWAIVLPRDKEDLINLVKWVNNGKSQITNHKWPMEKLSITCRGKGTDQAGGPINNGFIVRFPNYLDKILEIDKDFIRVEPGVLWSTVNDQLAKIKRFVPCYPASEKFSTIGGGVANNCAGEKTVKYGSMRDYALSLKVVLADGEEIEFKPLSQKEVTKKQQQLNLEGEIYRRVGDLLVANYNLIENSRLKVNKSSTGYWLHDILTESGLDFTKLICGSQGTLGIISEIKLKTIPKPMTTSLLLASFDSLEKAGSVVLDLLQLRPSSLEMVDKFLIEMIRKEKPEIIPDFLKNSSPAIILLIEFDNDNLDEINGKLEQAKKKLAGVATDTKEAHNKEEQSNLWQIRRSAAIVMEGGITSKKKALPFIEDCAVHPIYFSQYLFDLYEIMKKHNVEFSVWGHAGNGNVHIQPFLDLTDPADKEKLMAIASEVYQKVIALRGSISGEHNDGLMRSPFLKDEVGEPMYKLFKEIKNIFDPQNIFNPNKKIGVDLEFIKKHLRDEYEIKKNLSASR